MMTFERMLSYDQKEQTFHHNLLFLILLLLFLVLLLLVKIPESSEIPAEWDCRDLAT
jgi:hypothetical protein